MSKKIALVCIVTELIIIIYVGIILIHKRSPVLGTVTVTPIRKEYLIFPEQTTLEFFYEPIPDTKQVEHPDWLPYTATYTINSDSLNDRFNYSIAKPQNTFRIITQGDSFTFGEFVDTKDNWSERLEELLNTTCNPTTKYEVINLGVYGYDMQYSVERFKLRGEKYKPDLVLWLLLGERMNELMRPTIDAIEQTTTADELRVSQNKGDFSPAWTTALQRMLQKYSPLQRLEQERVFMRSLNEVYSGPLLFLVLPNVGSEYKARIRLHAAERPRSYFTDQLPNISAFHGQLPDGHPSATGHADYASYIFTHLNKLRAIPCLPL